MKSQVVNHLSFSAFLFLGIFVSFSQAHEEFSSKFQNQVVKTISSESIGLDGENLPNLATLLLDTIQSHEISTSLANTDAQTILEISQIARDLKLRECMLSFQQLKDKKLILTCQMNDMSNAGEFGEYLSESKFNHLQFSYDYSGCNSVQESGDGSKVQCELVFSLSLDLLQKNRFRTLDEESSNQTTIPQKDTKTSSFPINIDISETTLLMILGVLVFFVLIVVSVCIWLKKKKKRAQSKNNTDTQKLVMRTTGSPPVSLPELTSPARKLNPQNQNQNQNQLFSTDPNTGFSPTHTLKSVPNLKLDDDNRRSSLVQDGMLFTNIDDSPDSVGNDSSRTSVKNQPKTLDFHIEFSMVEQESIMKMKKNAENKLSEYSK